MKQWVLFFFLFLKIAIAGAQKDLREGFVVTPSADTLKGFIKYSEGAAAFKSCVYYASKDSEAITYLPSELSAYGYSGGRILESRKIYSGTEKEEIVFMQLLAKGKVSLFRFMSIFWLEKEGQQLTPLEILNNSNRHLGLLNSFLYDCPEIQNDILKTSLTERGLTKLLEKYNRCHGAASYAPKNTERWTHVSVSIEGGLNLTTLHLKTVDSYAYLKGKTNGTASPYFGIAGEFSSPRVSERLSFIAGIYYLSSDYDVYRETDTERNYVPIKLNQFKLPIGVRYKLSNKKLIPFVDGCVSITINQNPSVQRIRVTEDINNVVYTEASEPFELGKIQLGVLGGFGVMTSLHPKFNGLLKAQYEYTSGIASTDDASLGLVTRVTNFQITFGLQLK